MLGVRGISGEVPGYSTTIRAERRNWRLREEMDQLAAAPLRSSPALVRAGERMSLVRVVPKTVQLRW